MPPVSIAHHGDVRRRTGRQTAGGVFGTEFKRAAVERIVTGEKTAAELSHELEITSSAIRRLESGLRRGGVRVRMEVDRGSLGGLCSLLSVRQS